MLLPLLLASFLFLVACFFFLRNFSVYSVCVFLCSVILTMTRVDIGQLRSDIFGNVDLFNWGIANPFSAMEECINWYAFDVVCSFCRAWEPTLAESRMSTTTTSMIIASCLRTGASIWNMLEHVGTSATRNGWKWFHLLEIRLNITTSVPQLTQQRMLFRPTTGKMGFFQSRTYIETFFVLKSTQLYNKN